MGLGKRLSILSIAVAAGLCAATDDKIDRGLLNVLADDADAKAPFFVVFGDRADVKPAYRIADKAARANFVVQALVATANRSQAGVRGFLRGQKVTFTSFWVENKIHIPEGTLDLARALSRWPEVAAIIPVEIYKIPPPQVDANSTIQSIEWNISKINAPKVWSGTAPTSTGTGIVVANIDTGVQYNHPALVGKYRGNLGGGNFSHTGNWKDPALVCGAVGSPPCDNVGHGSHTMGTMVGDDGAGNQIGVAPGAKWIACKGCESGSCTSTSLLTCAQWILNPDGAAVPDVVNNSWGGGSGSTWYESYVQNWRAAGVFPAFSAGNSGPNCNTANSPGDYPESFASGATDSSDVIASFSSRGPSALGGILKPNISAPGVSVRSSVPSNSYAFYSGTSMASPHSAGSVALLWGAVPGYRGNIANTQTVFQDSAMDLVSSTQTCGGIPTGVSPNDVYGNGRLDIRAAVNLAAGTPVNQPPTVTISAPLNGTIVNCPATVDFQGTASDPEDGNLTTSITWKDNGVSFGGSGSPVSKTYACTDTGNHNIVASITDSKGATDTDTITISVVNPSIPATPTLSGSQSGSTITLNWTNVANETGYTVQRKKNGGLWTDIATKGAEVTTHQDTPGKGNWQYRVRAFNGSGTSAWSNILAFHI